MSEIKVKKPRTRNFLILAVLVLLGLSITGYQLINMQYQPVDSKDKSSVDIIIPVQSTASDIAEILQDKGIIRSKSAFLSYCRRTGYDSRLKAGHYKLRRSQSLKEIALIIAEGQVVTKEFTVPEGYTIDQIGDLLVRKGICSHQEWEEAVHSDYDYDFLEQRSGADNRLEGFLFPDTYQIDEDAEATEIVEGMLANFSQVWDDCYSSQAEKHNLSIYDTVTIASMIEREAMVSSERRTISGVINNRLRKGMPLQIDATVLYALKQHKDMVNYADLKVDSPYNTYRYQGLPPGPIACPGKSAIQAALNPEKHDYLYYVSRGDGSHCFSRTYEEHLQAIARYSK